eukprot:CAMPEP_0198692956 /NCGR_PEP_ID=MMETSP1468-20131203/239609_1 /TAXON_ID=1461545 /ORGANISM="Mantoniella sp, Strain CCMP1436" /LENGTH=48 /DNA_ID= /DNA_START= /DNA_END= /DNA_ORIENTATION=
MQLLVVATVSYAKYVHADPGASQVALHAATEVTVEVESILDAWHLKST